MYHVEIALFVIGIVLLVGGYRRNGHDLPLTGAVVPSLSAALPRFVGDGPDGVSGATGPDAASR
jgi:hypothetical protein